MRVLSKDPILPPLWILTCIFVCVLLWLCLQLKELIVLLVLGYFIAYAIEPLLKMLERRSISRGVGVFVVFGLLLSIVLLLAVTALPTVINEFDKLSTNLNEYIAVGKEKVGPMLGEARKYLPKALREEANSSDVIASVPSVASYVSGDAIKAVVNALIQTLLRGYSITLTLVNIALLPFIVYYVAVDWPKIHRFFLNAIPITKRRKVSDVVGEIDRYVSAFVRGQVTVCSILFGLYAAGLGFVGVDLWLLLAAITGFGNLVPYVGFLVGICLSSLMALVTFGDFTHLFWVWAVYAVVQFLEGTFITPRIIGESVGLPPLVVILALFAGGQLVGLLGVFLAVPAAATLRVLLRHSYVWVLDRR